MPWGEVEGLLARGKQPQARTSCVHLAVELGFYPESPGSLQRL